ncbi:MAG: hydroxyacylglutathione hydrolase [Pseudomonadota bacterium]
MPQLETLTIPCRTDNYAYLILAPNGTEAALVDAPEAAPIARALAARNLTLSDILVTHHHADHVEAVDALRTPATRVIGAKADESRLPALDLAVSDGDTIDLFGTNVDVMDASGHTMGHVAYYVPAAGGVFTADSLMALGCGHLFEGDAATMWATLTRLSALPPETRVYSGHEYTEANGRFAVTVDPDNPALRTRLDWVAAQRAQGKPTVPSDLAEELATNPFLRAASDEVKAHLGMAGASDVDAFAEVRRRKDRF